MPPDVPASIVEGSGGRGLIFQWMYNYTQLKVTVINSPSYFVGITGNYILAVQLAKIQNSNMLIWPNI